MILGLTDSGGLVGFQFFFVSLVLFDFGFPLVLPAISSRWSVVRTTFRMTILKSHHVSEMTILAPKKWAETFAFFAMSF